MALISYSAFSMYKKCPEQYRFQYKTRTRPPFQKNVRNFLEGSMIHKAVEESLKKQRPIDLDITKGLSTQVFEDVIKDQTKKGEIIIFNENETIDTVKGMANDLLVDMVQLIKDFKLDGADTLNEFWFGNYMNPFPLVDTVKIQGGADFIKDFGSYLGVYDSKTSKNKKYLDVDQLLLYAVCAEKRFNKPVKEIGFLMVRWKKMLYQEINEDRKKDFMDRLKLAVKMIEENKFLATPSSGVCYDCMFNSICKSAAKPGNISQHSTQDLNKKVEFNDLFSDLIEGKDSNAN